MVSWDFYSLNFNVDFHGFHKISIGSRGILMWILMWFHGISIGIHGIVMWI